MKQTSQIVGLSALDRLLAKLRSFSDVISYIGAGLLSLLLANSVLFAQISPFGVAFVAAVRGDYTFAAVLGSILGYLLMPGTAFKMKYIAAVLIIGAVKWALGGKHPLKWEAVLSPALAALVLGGTGIAVALGGDAIPYRLILLLCELLIAASATFFFARTLTLLDRTDHAPLRQNDVSCAIITFGLLIVALCSFSVAGVSFGRIAATLVILVCALKAGETGGAAGGVTAGVAVCLYDYSYAFLMGAYGFGGLMAGIFSGFGRFGCAVAFVLTNGIATALAALATPVTLAPVIEVFIASVIFVLLPPAVLARLTLAPSRAHALSADSVKGMLLNRLSTTRNALGEVSVITEKVADKLQKLEPPVFDIGSATAERVCRACPKRLSCWGEHYNDTAAALSDVCSLLRQNKTPTPQDLPEPIGSVCQNPQGLLTALTACYDEQRRQEMRFCKNVQLRSIVLDQWSGIEQLIGGISDDISRITVLDETLAGRIREYFKRRSISLRVLSCYEDAAGHIIIEITLDFTVARTIDRTEICLDLSEICDRDFSLPEPVEQGACLFLRFSERAPFAICHGLTQITASGKRLCGDSMKILDESPGVTTAILSDGMGSGSLAAIDSSMAAALIARLCAAGATPPAALRLVNSAMLIKSGDESLATVDICRADLYKGSVTLYKAGAAPSYVKKSGRVGFVESSSLPAGILNSVQFEETSLLLCEGDILLMVSDGVSPTGEDWVLDELERYTGTDMQILCERIATIAQLKRQDTHDDDITVCALLLHGAA